MRVVALLVLMLPLGGLASAGPAAADYKRYCVITETPQGPQPPTVCVVDPTG